MINSLDSAVQEYILKNGGNIAENLSGSYGTASVKIDHDGVIKYLVFKRAWFYTFVKQFPQCKGQGVGMGISKRFLIKAMNDNATIIFCVVDKFYEIPSVKMFQYVNKYRTFYHVKQDNDDVVVVSSKYLTDWHDEKATGMDNWL